MKLSRRVISRFEFKCFTPWTKFLKIKVLKHAETCMFNSQNYNNNYLTNNAIKLTIYVLVNVIYHWIIKLIVLNMILHVH